MQRLHTILSSIRPEAQFETSTDFISDGLLDSFDVVTLVAALDKEFGISIDGTDILPENFQDYAAIQSLLTKYGVSF